MRAWLRDLWTGEDGVTTVEYALLLALVALAAFLAYTQLGRDTRRVARLANRVLRRAMLRANG